MWGSGGFVAWVTLFPSFKAWQCTTNTQIHKYKYKRKCKKSVNTQMQKLLLVGWVTLILSLQSLAIHNNPSLHCKTRPRAIVTMGKCAQRAEWRNRPQAAIGLFCSSVTPTITITTMAITSITIASMAIVNSINISVAIISVKASPALPAPIIVNKRIAMSAT